MEDQGRPASAEDVHAVAAGMPDVVVDGPPDRPVYHVGGKTFVFFRSPRPDAVDSATGERYDDVVVIWVPDQAEKLALVQDHATPWFTTPHFNGHPSVLVRTSRLAELSLGEVTEVVQDAWRCRTSARRAAAWESEHRPDR
jgi:hypothetical protein